MWPFLSDSLVTVDNSVWMHVCEYLRSTWVSCTRLQMGSQPLSRLKPRFTSDNDDPNSNSLHTKWKNSRRSKQGAVLAETTTVYLEGTEVSRFLLKSTAVTPWPTAASNTSSGMAEVCFSLNTDSEQKRPTSNGKEHKTRVWLLFYPKMFLTLVKRDDDQSQKCFIGVGCCSAKTTLK